MPKYLSREWMDLAREMAQEHPETPGATARLQNVVTGGPEGDLRYYLVIENGRTVEQALGQDPDTETTLTASYDDSVKIASGELDENAAYMQGRLKITGNMAKVLALLPLTNKAEYKAIKSEIWEQTEL